MSSFKKLNKSEVTDVTYKANKQWTLVYCPYPTNDNEVIIYKGTKFTGSFYPDTEPITENQYERLVYDSINHMFYQNYTGSLNTSSLMYSLDNYYTASQYRPTQSYFIYNENPLFTSSFPTSSGDGIRVIAINQNKFGNKILPTYFHVSSSAYNITDDGNGNLYDGAVFVGNIFYSHGLAVITNQDYQLAFPLPPLAKNDYFTFSASTSPKTFNPLSNDSGRSGTLDTGSISLFGGQSSSFTNNGDGTITINESISGSYITYYTVNSIITGTCTGSITSNTASINISII